MPLSPALPHRPACPAPPGRRPARGLCLRAAGAAALVFALAAPVAADPVLQPWRAAEGSATEVAPPWTLALLPGQSLPATRFRMDMLDGMPTLRIEAEASYGNLVHPLAGAPGRGRLAWRWRVDRLNTAADLRRRDADDTSVKLCVLFDMPIAQVPFVERQVLRLARIRSKQPLPAATVCYVWDARLPEGSAVDNAYSRRVRMLVLRSGPAAGAGLWQREQRDIGADFLRLFGDESPTVPPLLAIAVGADADNTRGSSLAHLADLVLSP